MREKKKQEEERRRLQLLKKMEKPKGRGRKTLMPNTHIITSPGGTVVQRPKTAFSDVKDKL